MRTKFFHNKEGISNELFYYLHCAVLIMTFYILSRDNNSDDDSTETHVEIYVKSVFFFSIIDIV